MALSKLTFGKVWTSNTDFPTYQTDEEQVRADMQYHPDAVKDYINNTLLKALEAKGAAAELGAVDSDGVKGTVQSVLDSHKASLAQLKEDIETVASGGVPSVLQNTSITFTTGSWAMVNGKATLTIAKSEHKRDTANFGYNLYQLVGEIYKSGTWGTAATGVTYNANGSITLTADETYSGKIVLFGL